MSPKMTIAYDPFLRDGNPVIYRNLLPALLRLDGSGNDIVELRLGEERPGTHWLLVVW